VWRRRLVGCCCVGYYKCKMGSVWTVYDIMYNRIGGV
jgi:hypothetical protein